MQSPVERKLQAGVVRPVILAARRHSVNGGRRDARSAADGMSKGESEVVIGGLRDGDLSPVRNDLHSKCLASD